MSHFQCPECGGNGYIVEERGGGQVARLCACQASDKSTRLVKRAAIPQRYWNRYVFKYFEPKTTDQEEAKERARRYAEEYPALPQGKNGLLFMGPCGVGKTHLGVAILQVILVEKGLPALFVDLNDLFRELWNTYRNSHADMTEYDIMTPLVEAPLLLIDELGCLNSAWAQDTLHYLISQRYNELRPTLCTTNYLDEPRAKEPSLEERIGARTRSRLFEMCQMVNMDGEDHRAR